MMENICFCINDNYVMPAGILIKSIIENNEEEYAFNIISEGLTERNKSLLLQIIDEYHKCCINFMDIDSSIFEKLIIRKNNYVTKDTYFRFLIPDLFDESIEKVLYLDVDMLCVNSIHEIFQIDLSGYSCAMAPDIIFKDVAHINRLNYDSKFGYHNAGFILMNLAEWRKNNYKEKCINFISENPSLCVLYDQDAINKILHESILTIDVKFNAMIREYYLFSYLKNDFNEFNLLDLYIERRMWDNMIPSLKEPVIIHLTGFFKPWHKEAADLPFSKLWNIYYSESPWKHQKLRNYPYPVKVKIKKLIKSLLGKNINEKNHYDSKVIEIEENLITKKMSK